MTVRKPLKSRTSYYAWEGDACRLHEKKNGDQVADIYRGGRGLLPINPADLLFSARQIGPAEYRDLVHEEKALHERKSLKS
ncbi:MAG: hypothetical protein WBQ43_05120 [Terriglobales bacterium]